MISAAEARSLLSNRNSKDMMTEVESRLQVLDQWIVGNNGQSNWVNAGELFGRFDLFDSQTEKLNNIGQELHRVLTEKYGYQVFVREERWNDGPDFLIYWGDPERFAEFAGRMFPC